MDTRRTRLRFWGGLNTIGGTIVSVEYKNDRVIFDFGLLYQPDKKLEGQVNLREESMVKDYLRLKQIPPIDGIYSRHTLGHLTDDIESAEDSEKNTIIVVSHLHLDHMGAIGFVSPQVPIFLSRDALNLYTLLEKVGEGVRGTRSYQACDFDTPLSVGHIQITPVRIEHDVLGACGYIIQTPDLKLVYTGDFRLHGKHREWTENFIKRAKEANPDILILEGTTLKDSTQEQTLTHVRTETELQNRVTSCLQAHRGVGIFNIYHRNIERVKDMLSAARQAGRLGILEPETAFLISTLSADDEFQIYLSSEMKKLLNRARVPHWLPPLLQRFGAIEAEGINMDPSRYFVQNSYRNVLELLDMTTCDGVYIHSNGVPLGSFDPAYLNLQGILAVTDIYYENMGCTGHAVHADLKHTIDEINPKVCVPLHSMHPQSMYPQRENMFLPRYGVYYCLDNKKMRELD